MAAQKDTKKTEPQYFHISRELTRKKLFIDDTDYERFLGFLKDYFASPENLSGDKKTFTIRGRTYKGTPRKPKNFHEQAELVAYKLEPNRFDLLVKENVSGAHKKLIRAISTRYAIYFNKKYKRKGALFPNPYESELISGPEALQLLTQELHSSKSRYSSYPEYHGKRKTSWLKSREIPPANEDHPAPNKRPQLRIPELIAASMILLVLSSLSLNNIHTFNTLAAPVPSAAPKVLGEKKVKPITKTFAKITINDGSTAVNLRQGPTTSSAKVGKAYPGDRFEYVKSDFDWYEIRLDDGSSAYVSERYAKLESEIVHE